MKFSENGLFVLVVVRYSGTFLCNLLHVMRTLAEQRRRQLDEMYIEMFFSLNYLRQRVQAHKKFS